MSNFRLIRSDQSFSRVRLFATPWISTPGLPVHHQLLEFTQTHVHWVSDAIQPSHPLSSTSPPAPIPPSIAVFSNESTLRMRWPEYWSFSFSISPSNEHPGLISFRMDCLDLLAVQGTLKSSPIPQFKSINSSVLSFLYGPALTPIHGNTIALTKRTFSLDHCPRGWFRCSRSRHTYRWIAQPAGNTLRLVTDQ